ncbi:MAG: hypothetical protein PVF33_06605, partial [Candidatus Latescibacterota bacterium]
ERFFGNACVADEYNLVDERSRGAFVGAFVLGASRPRQRAESEQDGENEKRPILDRARGCDIPNEFSTLIREVSLVVLP